MKLMSIDIGGSAIKYGLYQRGRLSRTGEVPTPLTRQEFLDALVQIKKQLKTQVDGCAISCPGDVDEQTGMVNGVSFAPFLHLFPIRDTISETLSLPVSMINDAQAAATAEMAKGAGKGMDHPLFMIIGSGVGVALVKEGEVVLKPESGAEKQQKWLADLIRSYKGISASPVQQARIMSVKKLETPDTYDGKDLYELAAQGDETANNRIDNMYRSLAEIILSLDAALQPEFFIMGGGITNNKAFVQGVKNAVKAMTKDKTWMVKLLEFFNTSSDQTPKVKTCRFRNKANLLGACIHFEKTQTSV